MTSRLKNPLVKFPSEVSSSGDEDAKTANLEESPLTPASQVQGRQVRVMDSLRSLINLLPTVRPPTSSQKTETLVEKNDQRQGLDGFSLTDLLPGGLR